MLALRPYRTTEESLADRLPWGSLIASGVVLCKDGSLLAGWFVRGPDLSGEIMSAHDYVAERANAAVARLGSGWAVWVEADRLPVSEYIDRARSHFPDPVSQAVDDERREQFTAPDSHFESEYVVLLQYYPPERHKAWIADVIYSGDDDDLPVQDETIKGFERSLAMFEDALSSGMVMRRMRDTETSPGHLVSELVNFLHFTVTNEVASLDLLPDNYLDTFVGGVDFDVGEVLRVGSGWIACVRINGFPALSDVGMMAGLEEFPFPLRFATRFIAIDTVEAKNQIKSIERKWRQRVRGFWAQVLRLESTHVDQDALAMATQAGAAMSHSSSASIGTGYYTAVVVVPAPTERQAAERARMVARALTNAGFASAVETINTPEAWMGSLPGNTLANVRRPPLHTDNLAHMLPLASINRGQPESPCPLYPPHSPALMMVERAGAVPVYANVHVDDMGNTLIFGPPGSGKSTLMAFIAMQAMRYQGATVWSFDKGMSMFATTMAVGGRHYDFGAPDAPQLCPLQYLDGSGDIAAAEAWIEGCFVLQHNRQLDTDERDRVHDAIMALAEPGSERTITAFIAMVQSDAVRDALRPYSLHGPYGHIFDAERDGLGDGRFVTFEIGALMAMGEKVLVPALFHIFRRFEAQLRDQPAFLNLDEVWVMLGRELFREKIREYLKTLRKLNCAVIMGTQSLSDAYRSGLLDVMLEACPTRIMGANHEAASGTGSNANPGPREYYEMMGFNPAEIELIRGADAKRQYYWQSPTMRMLMELSLGPKVLALVGAGSKSATITRIKALVREYGAGWVEHWWQERGA